MTLDEFEDAHPREAVALSTLTGCWTRRHADWIRRGGRMDVIGVYEDDGSWIAHVEHLSGDALVVEMCRWYDDHVRPDPHMTHEPGAWRWLGENGRPCDSQGSEDAP